MKQARDVKGHELPAIVLVHGAWTDGSAWRELIALLQKRRIRASAVQIPLLSLSTDAEAVTRAVRRQRATVILVGHGYGGTVITQAGNDTDVVGLLYIAAFAPDSGESTIDAHQQLAATPFLGRAQIEEGFAYLPTESFREYFAHDLPAVESRVLAAVQAPISIAAVRDRVSLAAWRSKPSGYLVTTEDRMFDPRLQREHVCRIQAHSIDIHTGHVPFLSNPKDTALAVIQVAEAIAGL